MIKYPVAAKSRPSSIHCLINPENRGNKKYDVIFTSFLLHCLPGPPERKARALAELSHLIEPASGVLCGATILGKGSREACHSMFGRFVLFSYNLQGWFDNGGGDTEVFVQVLEGAFKTVSCQVIGAVLLFKARYPRQSGKA